MRVSNWQQKHNERAKRAFIEYCGDVAAVQRAAQIATLDSKVWRGQVVYRLTCHADFGKGPHDQFVPEGLLWALIDLRGWRCPFHKG